MTQPAGGSNPTLCFHEVIELNNSATLVAVLAIKHGSCSFAVLASLHWQDNNYHLEKIQNPAACADFFALSSKHWVLDYYGLCVLGIGLL